MNPLTAPFEEQLGLIVPEQLGDTGFCQELGIRYPYLGGSMAKGISSVPLAIELGKAGMLGFSGAAGLPLAAVEAALIFGETLTLPMIIGTGVVVVGVYLTNRKPAPQAT